MTKKRLNNICNVITFEEQMAAASKLKINLLMQTNNLNKISRSSIVHNIN